MTRLSLLLPVLVLLTLILITLADDNDNADSDVTSPSSSVEEGPFTCLQPDIICKIGHLLNMHAWHSVMSVNKFFRETLKMEVNHYNQLLHVLLYSQDWEPYLYDHIWDFIKIREDLIDNGAVNADLNASTRDLCNLYGRVCSLPDPIRRKEVVHALQKDDAFRLFRELENVQPGKCLKPSMLCEVLQRQYQIDLDLNGHRTDQYYGSEKAMIRSIKTSGKSQLLWDEKFLSLLVEEAMLRPSLPVFLYHDKAPEEGLTAILPFFNDWPFQTQSFFQHLLLLRSESSETRLDDFWQIPGIKEHFRDYIEDLVPEITSSFIVVLQRVQYPYLDDLLTSRRCENLLRGLPYDDLSSLMNDVLTQQNLSRYRVPFETALKVVLKDGNIIYPRWKDIPDLAASLENFPEWLQEIAPDTEWLTTALQIADIHGESLRLDQCGMRTAPFELDSVINLPYLHNLMELVGVPPIPGSPRRQWFNGDVDFLDKMMERLGGPECDDDGDLTTADVVLEAKIFRWDLLLSVMNERDSKRNTMLHHAVFEGDYDLVIVLLSLPGIDITAVNVNGLTPFDFIDICSFDDFKFSLSDEAIGCIEALARHVDAIRVFSQPDFNQIYACNWFR